MHCRFGTPCCWQKASACLAVQPTTHAPLPIQPAQPLLTCLDSHGAARLEQALLAQRQQAAAGAVARQLRPPLAEPRAVHLRRVWAAAEQSVFAEILWTHPVWSVGLAGKLPLACQSVTGRQHPALDPIGSSTHLRNAAAGHRLRFECLKQLADGGAERGLHRRLGRLPAMLGRLSGGRRVPHSVSRGGLKRGRKHGMDEPGSSGGLLYCLLPLQGQRCYS